MVEPAQNAPTKGPRAGWVGAASLFACLLFGAAAPPVHAQAEEAPRAAGQEATEPPIPLPDDRPPSYAGEVRLGLVLPVVDQPLCPDGAACVFGTGATVSGLFERRWVKGVALGVALDLWFVDGDGVYEVTTMQSLSATLRYRFLRERMTHPFVGVGVGGLVLGDSFSPAAGGGLVDGMLGVEIEMSRSLAVVISTVWRLFMTSSFRTSNDGVARVEDQGVNVAATLQLGLVIME